MSNTASVSPYEQNDSRAEVIGEVIGAVIDAMARTPSERDRIARYQELARQDRLAAAKLTSQFATVRELTRSAAQLGYRAASTGGGGKLHASRPVELRAADGSALLIHRTSAGLSVLSTGSRAPIDELVRSVAVERVERHLATSGNRPVQRKLPGGEVEFTAPKHRSTQGSAATVKAVVAGDGRVNVDIEGACGGECVGMVDELATAVGGDVVHRKIKPDYYVSPAAPGEPVRI